MPAVGRVAIRSPILLPIRRARSLRGRGETTAPPRSDYAAAAWPASGLPATLGNLPLSGGTQQCGHLGESGRVLNVFG